MTIARRDWRGLESGQALVERHSAFGWIVHRHVLPVGAAMVVVASSGVERARAPNRALYVRGLASVTLDDGTSFPNRVPGLFTAERPDHPAGIVTVRAIDETEFWCFNWHANRGALPGLTPLRYPDGGVFSGQEGDRVLVCSGGLGRHAPGDSFRVGGDELVAEPGTYALLMEADRA